MADFKDYDLANFKPKLQELLKTKLKEEVATETQNTDGVKEGDTPEEDNVMYQPNNLLYAMSFQSLLNYSVENNIIASNTGESGIIKPDAIPLGPQPYIFSYPTAIKQAVHECGLTDVNVDDLELHYANDGDQNVFMFEYGGKKYNVITDKDGNMKTVEEYNGSTLLRTIEMSDSEKTESIYNGEDKPSQVNHYKRDVLGNPENNPSSWQNYDKNGKLTRDVFNVTYDDQNRYTGWTDRYDNGETVAVTQQFGDEGQLVSRDEVKRDANGNVISVVEATEFAPQTNATLSWNEYSDIDKQNLVKTVSDITFDENGQMDYWKETYPDGSSQMVFTKKAGGSVTIPANGQIQVTFNGRNFIIKNNTANPITEKIDFASSDGSAQTARFWLNNAIEIQELT